MTSSIVVLRSAHTAWQAQEADLEKAAVAHSVLRHIVRGMRQATGVVAISAAANPAGSLTIARANGTTATWAFTAGAVNYSENGGAAQPLAEGLASMSFQGYRANGVTLTSEPGNVQAVRAAVATTMPVGGNRTVSSFSWVRSW